jgi:hypothetical protein
MRRGYCSHPAKQTRIVTEWKCVDIQFPKDITQDELNKRRAECRTKDYYGVCELCKFYTVDADQPAGSPVTSTNGSAYTPTKPESTDNPAQPESADDPQWDSMMDEII